MNIVVFLSPYKQKMPSTEPSAVVFLRRSLIHYFLQETKREVPNYFQSSVPQRQTADGLFWDIYLPSASSGRSRDDCGYKNSRELLSRECPGGGARTHTLSRTLY